MYDFLYVLSDLQGEHGEYDEYFVIFYRSW